MNKWLIEGASKWTNERQLTDSWPSAAGANWNLEMLVFWGRRKTREPGKHPKMFFTKFLICRSTCLGAIQGRSQTFRTDEASVASAKVRASSRIWGMLPRKMFKSTPSEMLFSAFFSSIFLQNSISCKWENGRFFSAFNISYTHY